MMYYKIKLKIKKCFLKKIKHLCSQQVAKEILLYKKNLVYLAHSPIGHHDWKAGRSQEAGAPPCVRVQGVGPSSAALPKQISRKLNRKQSSQGSNQSLIRNSVL